MLAKVVRGNQGERNRRGRFLAICLTVIWPRKAGARRKDRILIMVLALRAGRLAWFLGRLPELTGD